MSTTSSPTWCRRSAADAAAVSLARALCGRPTRDWAERILAHRFVRGLGDGSLPIDSFKGYVAQDAYFLEAFARAYAFCLANGTSREDLYGFAELIAGVLEELEAAQELCRALAGRRSTGVTPIAATQRLCRFPAGHAAARRARRDDRRP